MYVLQNQKIFNFELFQTGYFPDKHLLRENNHRRRIGHLINLDAAVIIASDLEKTMLMN